MNTFEISDDNVRMAIEVPTNYVKETTFEALKADELPHVIVCMTGEYGCMLWVPSDADDLAERVMPEELLALMAFAREQGFAYLVIDRDALPLDEKIGLPTFEW